MPARTIGVLTKATQLVGVDPGPLSVVRGGGERIPELLCKPPIGRLRSLQRGMG